MAPHRSVHGVVIRPGSPRDITGVLEMWREAAAVPSDTDDVEGLTTLVAHDPGALIVADEDGRIVGSIIVGWDGWRGAFHRLAVVPDRRRAGIARQLVLEGERRLQALGARRSAAVVVSQHDYAVRFWETLEYEADGWATRYVKNVAADPAPALEAPGLVVTVADESPSVAPGASRLETGPARSAH